MAMPLCLGTIDPARCEFFQHFFPSSLCSFIQSIQFMNLQAAYGLTKKDGT